MPYQYLYIFCKKVMKKPAFIFPFLAAAIISCNNTTSNKAANTQMVDSQSVVTAHVKASTPPPPPVDSATMMKNAMDYMTPGDVHKMLASYSGKWSEEMTMWMGCFKTANKKHRNLRNKNDHGRALPANGEQG